MPASSRSFRVSRLFLTMLVIFGQVLGMLPPPVQAAVVRPATAPPMAASDAALPLPATDSAFAQASLPLDLQYALSQELGLNDAAYHLGAADAGLSGANDAQGLRTRFDNLGMQLNSGAYGWGIELAGFGRGDMLGTVIPGAQLQTEFNRVEFDHGAFTSWYVNGPLGVQQGWTVRNRPSGTADQLLTLALLQSGNLRAALDDDGRGVQLRDERGTPRLSYGGLIAFDAEGKDLPVTLDLIEGCRVARERCISDADHAEVIISEAIRIRVDDRGATYPITIDPWVKSDSEPKPGTESGNFAYGQQSAISSDGSTIAVSAPSANPTIYVFSRDAYGVIDTNATARLTFATTGQHQRETFGQALAISADGSTIVWGTRNSESMSSINQSTADNAYVFVRPGAAWVDGYETTTLTPLEFTDGGGKRRFGHLDGDIAVSADGGTIVISSSTFSGCLANGECYPSGLSGGSYVFVRPGAAWSAAVVNQATVLSSDDQNYAGGEVAISADGGTVVFGSFYTSGAYRALRNGTTWSANWLYPGLVSGASRVVELSFGSSSVKLDDVAMNSAGTLFAAISYLSPSGRGAINVWTNAATTAKFWMQTPEDNTYGLSISLSGDDSLLAYPIMQGTAARTEVIKRPDTGWPSTGTTVTSLPVEFTISGGNTDTQMTALLSGDGSTVLVKNIDGSLDVYLTEITAPTPSPSFAVAGGDAFTLTLQGSGFSTNTRVRWNNINLPISFTSSSEISVEVPAERITTPGTVQISVANPMPGGGVASFTYQIAYPEPILTSLDPATSYAGEPSLSLNAIGSDFAANSVILWNGSPISTTFVNNSLLRAGLSAAQIAAVSAVSVTVSTPAPGGGTSSALTHTLTAAPTPVLSGISPFSRVAGKSAFTLTAVGSDFTRRSQIVWGSTVLSTTYVNATTLTANVSSDLIVNEATVNVVVRTAAPGGGDSAAQPFAITSAAPSISDIFPFFGPPAGGSEVTISGANLESTSAVMFGLNAATVLTATETTLIVAAPPGLAGSVDVMVMTAYGTATALGGFVYADSEPAQPWRSFGDVRIWADTFVTDNGVTTATGKVVIGNGPLNQRLYRVSGQISWTTSDTLTLSGTLGFFGGISLSSGTYDLNTATGVITARAGTLPLITTLGATNLAISPQLTINALADVVRVQAALVLNLPENPTLGMSVRYLLGRNGSITADGTGPLSMKLAGGTLTAAVAAYADGLRATGSQLALPGMAAISMPALLINDSGLQLGSGATFALPMINLGNGVLSLKEATASLVLAGAAYELALSGSLELSNLPETANNRTIAVSGWKLADARFQGTLANQSMTMGGAPLSLSGMSLQYIGERYVLSASGGVWSLPSAWSSGPRPTVNLSSPTISTEAPFIRFNGASSFTAPGNFSLGGNPSTRNRVTFEQVRGDVRLDGTRWLVDLTVNIRIHLGSQANDGGFYENVVLTVGNDTLSGTISNARLNIGGLPLVANLAYGSTAFSATAATLTLPKVWKSMEVNTGGILISPTTLAIGPAVGVPSFSIPNITLGIIAFSNNNARVEFDSSDRYLLRFNSTLVINGLKTASGLLPSTPIEATIKGGRISGTIGDLEFSVSGFTMNAKNLQLVDGIIRSPKVQLQLPSKLSGVTTTLYRLEIGGASNFSVQGGAFKLPDFKIGMVGVQNVSASFLKDGSEYVIEAQGRMEFKKFAVEAAFKIAYSDSSGGAEVRRVMLAFEGEIPSPAIPLGSTGLYFTRISGEFSLEDESLTITLGTRLATPGKVGNDHFFSLDASVTLQLKPSFEFRARADAYVVGMRAATAEVRIWGSGFSLKGSAEIGIIRASLELTFGADIWNEFTFYGELRAALIIPRGIIMDETILFKRISIPPSDIPLAEARLDGGKFRDGNDRFWGARGSLSIMGGLFSVDAVVRFGRNGGVDFGSDIWRYDPVRPRDYLRAFSGGLPILNATPLRDTFTFEASNPGLSLMLVEVLTDTQRLSPLPIQISSPQNVPFTATPVFTDTDGVYRIYDVQVNQVAAMVGTWTVNPAWGNEIQPLGMIPPPEITAATFCPVGGSCAAPGAQIVLEDNQALDLSWRAKSYTPGLSLDVYATDQRGERSYITSTLTLDQALTGNMRWRPALAGGTYTVTAELIGDSGAPVRQDLAIIVYTDAGAPAKPQGLTATPQHDLSVLLRWDSIVADADILGYQMSVDGGAPIEADGKVDTLRSYGLAPGSTYTIAVAAYDLSGNVGEAAEVTVTMPSIGVSGSWPSDGAITRGTYTEIGGVFSGSITGATISVTDASGAVVRGATTVLTAEVLLETLEAGITPLTIDAVGGIAVVETGAVFVPEAAQLAPGIYRATLSAWDPKTQTQVTASWSFTILPPIYKLYLPILQQN